ncbi:MAG: glycosyltransferase, partial [Muribaculaceae bacterium]|nr:glycosyltransferase [Muribaculaceae bacterium]
SREVSDVYLNLIGRREEKLDPLQAETINLIKNNNRIIEFGQQTDIRPFLKASDIFVLPSYREGFPNVVLEAAAMGLPCIVSEVNGATDVIQNNINGLIIPKRDSEALYQAMKKLYLNSTLRKQMASVARSVVSERFNRMDIWQATLDMYNSL